MPGYDRTGPMGHGPMTGGGRGLCAGGRSGQESAMRAGRGRRGGGFGGRGGGFGGRGGGFGWRHQFNATGLTRWQRAGYAVQESPQVTEALESQSDPFARIEASLASVIERLDRLEAARQS